MSDASGGFEVRVEVRDRGLRAAAWAASDHLDRIALVVDFRRLRALIQEALASRPHAQELAAPALAAWLLERLQGEVEGAEYRVIAVEVSDDEGISFIVQSESGAGPRSADPDPHRGV